MHLNSYQIYYDAQKQSCTEAAALLKAILPSVTLIPISECREYLIFTENNSIGFIFQSSHGKLPEEIKYITSHLVVNKKSYLFALITGGSRELTALKALSDKLKTRGMHLSSAYTEYMLNKFSSDSVRQMEKIALDLEASKETLKEIKQSHEQLSRNEFRKLAKSQLKDYIRFKHTKRIENKAVHHRP